MTSSPASASGLEGIYDRLHPKIRRWIRDQGWAELREIQARTGLAVFDGPGDIVIAATTAAGKTEAAFLPVLTQVAERTQPGFSVLYVSPLKALINDQHFRLGQLCESMEIQLVKWHGDAPASAKKRARDRPSGVALITPESMEAMLARRPMDARRLLGAADFVIVDELHAFLRGPRGLHLASLLKRIDAMDPSRAPARRIGLSATIGDLGQAASWLRPVDPASVRVLEAKSDAPELKLQIRGYVEPPEMSDPDHAEGTDLSGAAPPPVDPEREYGLPLVGPNAAVPAAKVALDAICDHIYATMRGSNNLVFGGSRRTVESAADRLRRRADVANVPNEFFPHHGSLSKVLREELEIRLKDGTLPTTAVCTSTLELGIDIGSVKSVAGIGAPRSISSLRQRLGRTGRRRGSPSILRVYVREPYLTQDSSMLDHLRPGTVRATAAIRLLLEGFVESVGAVPEVVSTLIHQMMSVLAERGGIRAKPLFVLLCGPGPFASVSMSEFAALLHHLASKKLIEQAPDGTLMLGPAGEAIVQAKEFFAVFESAEEWRLMVGRRVLGTLPVAYPVHKDSLVVFAGKRWIVLDIDLQTKTFMVAPHPGGVVPRFERTEMEPSDDRLGQEMLAVYRSSDEPPYLDKVAAECLAEGREAFRYLSLHDRSLLIDDGSLHVMLWKGSQTAAVFGAVLGMAGIPAEAHDLGITLPKTDLSEGRAILKRIAAMEEIDPADVAATIENVSKGKFADFVPTALAETQWAMQNAAAIAAVPEMARLALVGGHLVEEVGVPQTAAAEPDDGGWDDADRKAS